ncbi:hypothetical protein ENSA5_55200 [Enhygromyxa salina]|uniref:Cytochrome P460 domain-containing protein n=1 Tax=Enhygromyxa salina TaxID=215803 RepID=A0A2S9XEW2_9BACT|nr:hypothetical protein [Enhygromyxa salina]PRP91403.1 hypothetical protein ENSA5_55200 [Enhygromyxa salina]
MSLRPCLPPRLSLVCSFCLFGLAACAEDEEPETFDPDAVIAEAVDYEANYVRLDLDGVPTAHDSGGMVVARMWANEAGAEVFRTLDPDDPTQMVEMPRGAVFVKENYDLDGNPLDFMQVLAKFEDGYYPDGNDWFSALIQRDGTPLQGRIGKGPEITFCVDCHSSMGKNTDFIIGLPADQLAP